LLLMLSDCPEDNILRAVDTFHVLKGFGRIFAEGVVYHSAAASGTHNPYSSLQGITSEEAQNLYDTSFCTKAIKRFLSHSWSAGRMMKWGALADLLHRNTAVSLAFACWFLVTALGTSLRLSSSLPVPSFTISFLIFTIAPCTMLFLTFAFGHLICGLSSDCFLDKLCIHQSDPKLKAEGVRALSNFVDISQILTVLWSDDYFERLWCVLEVATFGSKHGAASMEIRPLWLTPFLYCMLLTNVAVMLMSSYLQSSPWFVNEMALWGPSRGIGMLWSSCELLPGIVTCIILSMKIRKHRAIDDYVANFKLDDTKVTVEDDRAVVYEQIRKMFGSTQEFEDFVHHDLREALNKAMGPIWSVPYSWGVFIFQPYLWYSSTDAFAMSQEAIEAQGFQNWRTYFLANTYWYFAMLLILPFCLKLVGISTALTSRWPLLLGMLVNISVFLVSIWLITSVFMFSCLALFTNSIDASFWGPIPAVAT